MSKDPPLSLTSFVEYYHEMLKYFKTRVLGKVMIHCYYSRLHFGFSFSFPTLVFFIKQNSNSKEVQIGDAVESVKQQMRQMILPRSAICKQRFVTFCCFLRANAAISLVVCYCA